MKGDLQREIGDYSQAIRLNPKQAIYYAGRAAGYCGVGEYDQAITDCSQAIRLDPELAEAYASRGGAYGHQGHLDQAMCDLNEALRLNPQLVEGHLNRAILFIKKGDADGAIGDLSEIIQINPTDAASYKIRGLLYSSKHDFDQAIKDFTSFLKSNPTNTDVYVHRMGAHWLNGDFQEAIADCRTVVRLNPSASFYWRELSMMLSSCPGASVRDQQEAVEAAQKACELTGWKEPLCLVTLAEAYANSGDFEQALKYQKQALAMTDWPAPQRDEMQRRLALYQQGKPYHEAVVNSAPRLSANPAGGTARLLTNPGN
jgi:tetratricopeptide (TPR) repeat protein